jgi:hypothetical protein
MHVLLLLQHVRARVRATTEVRESAGEGEEQREVFVFARLSVDSYIAQLPSFSISIFAPLY